MDMSNKTGKRCCHCKVTKDLDSFHRNRRMVDGLTRECKTCVKEYNARHYKRTRKTRLQWQKEYRERNLEYRKEYDRMQSKRHYQENKEKYYEKTATRRASKLERTPSWLTEDHKEDIRDLYKLARKLEKLCGAKYHVDHIVPLQGKDVSGLHVPWNLQLLEASMNLSKGNKYGD